MILISHRGNINGPAPDRENHPDYILQALKKVQAVEIDVWYQDNNWALGHDSPTYEINKHFLLNENFWCHAKNIDALVRMNLLDNHYFWHQKDDYTLTTGGFIWAYPGQSLTSKTICVMPEKTDYTKADISRAAGICSDFISTYKESYQ